MKYLHIPFIKGEIWRRYPRLPERFVVSDHGRILSLHTARILTTSIDRYGYERISVIVGSRTDKTRKTLNLKVHQMVAETFLYRPAGGDWTVNHKDLNKRNNKLQNLEWLTITDNMKHAWVRGVFEASGFTGRKHSEATKRKIARAARLRQARRRLGV